jgi:retron-type reverse transcriptase
LATLNEVIAGSKIGWVLEVDLKNFFGSLSHDWLLRFVEHRVGDPRLISLIRRWLKAGVLEDGDVHPNEEGTPPGGSISVLLSNVYLHYNDPKSPLYWSRRFHTPLSALVTWFPKPMRPGSGDCPRRMPQSKSLALKRRWRR